MSHIKVGSFAVCNQGIVGVCTSVERDDSARLLYIGKTLDGKHWQTSHPRWIRSEDVAQIRQALSLGVDVLPV